MSWWHSGIGSLIQPHWYNRRKVVFCLYISIAASMVASTGSLTQIVVLESLLGEAPNVVLHESFSSFLSFYAYNASLFCACFILCFFGLCLALLSSWNSAHLLRDRTFYIVICFIASLVFSDVCIAFKANYATVNYLSFNCLADVIGGFIGGVVVVTCIGSVFLSIKEERWLHSFIIYRLAGIAMLSIVWITLLFFLFFEVVDEPFEIRINSLQPLVFFNKDASLQLIMHTVSPMIGTNNSFPHLNSSITEYSSLYIALSKDSSGDKPVELGVLLGILNAQYMKEYQLPENALDIFLSEGKAYNSISEDKKIMATALNIEPGCYTYFASHKPIDLSASFSNMRILVFSSGDLTDPEYKLNSEIPNGIKNISFLYSEDPGNINLNIFDSTLLYAALPHDYNLIHSDGTKEIVKWCDTQIRNSEDSVSISAVLKDAYDLERMKNDSSSRIITTFKIQENDSVRANLHSSSLGFLSKDVSFLISAHGNTAIDFAQNRPEVTLSGKTIANDGSSAIFFQSPGNVTVSGEVGHLSIRGEGVLSRGKAVYGDKGIVYMEIKNIINMRRYQYIPSGVAAVLLTGALTLIGFIGNRFIKRFIAST